MSSNGRAINFEDSNESELVNRSHNPTVDVGGRAVPDAVHERFRPNLVYCDNCKKQFIGNDFNISKHFSKSHPAENNCVYCPGKVFHYYKVKDGNDMAEKFYYHRCKDWLSK